MLSIILLVLLIKAEGGTLKMKSKSSKEKETVAPHIVRNPGDTSVVRGDRVFLECEVEPRSSVKSCSWTKSGSENPQTVQAAYREGRGEGGETSQKTDPASANK